MLFHENKWLLEHLEALKRGSNALNQERLQEKGEPDQYRVSQEGFEHSREQLEDDRERLRQDHEQLNKVREQISRDQQQFEQNQALAGQNHEEFPLDQIRKAIGKEQLDQEVQGVSQDPNRLYQALQLAKSIVDGFSARVMALEGTTSIQCHEIDTRGEMINKREEAVDHLKKDLAEAERQRRLGEASLAVLRGKVSGLEKELIRTQERLKDLEIDSSATQWRLFDNSSQLESVRGQLKTCENHLIVGHAEIKSRDDQYAKFHDQLRTSLEGCSSSP